MRLFFIPSDNLKNTCGIIPSLQGMLADITSIQSAFVLTPLCYLYIAFYGIKGANTIPHK
jgi:fucose permease